MSNDESDPHAMRARRLEDAGMWLIRLQEDTLREEEMSAWVEWCERDPKNLEAFEQLRSVYQAVDRAPAARRPLLYKRIPVWAAMAASVVLVLAISAVFFAAGRWPDAEHVAGRAVVQTPVARNQPAILPDGSHVEVGGDSYVAVQYSEELRKLQLRNGEAFFQVKHDTSRPFVVHVADLQIVAVGTAFNVRRAGAQIVVTVQEGAVEVRRSDGASASARLEADGSSQLVEPMLVEAGHQLVVDNRLGEAHASSVDPAVALAWRAGRLEFAGDTLDAVVASVNRYAAQPITLGDPRLAELTFTGTVFFDSIDAWLDGLQEVFPVVVERTGSGEIVLRPRPRTQARRN